MPIIPAQEKSLSEMTSNDKKVLSSALSWQGKTLPNCSKSELIACILHLTAQVVVLKNRLDKVEIQPDGSQILEVNDAQPIQ